eukprot:g4993.t1
MCWLVTFLLSRFGAFGVHAGWWPHHQAAQAPAERSQPTKVFATESKSTEALVSATPDIQDAALLPKEAEVSVPTAEDIKAFCESTKALVASVDATQESWSAVSRCRAWFRLACFFSGMAVKLSGQDGSREDDARRTGGQAATPTEVAAQAEDSASQVPAERRRVTGKNWKATDVSYEELRWHFLQVPTIEAASRKSILLTKREEDAHGRTPPRWSMLLGVHEERAKVVDVVVLGVARRVSRARTRCRCGEIRFRHESAELREKRKEMLQGGADESDSSPEKPALAAPDPTDASSTLGLQCEDVEKDSEPEDSLKTEEIAEEAPALLSAAPPRREAEETPSTAEPSVSAPGPAPGSAPSQTLGLKGTKTEDPLKTEALTLEIPVTPGQSWRKMHISPCKERRRRPGSTSPKSSRNACVTGTAESRTKSLGAGDDSPKNHWKGAETPGIRIRLGHPDAAECFAQGPDLVSAPRHASGAGRETEGVGRTEAEGGARARDGDPREVPHVQASPNVRGGGHCFQAPWP